MAPKDLSSHIGRVRPDRDRPPAGADILAEPSASEPLEPLPAVDGIDDGPFERDLAPVPFWRRIVAFALDSLVVVTLQMAMTITGILWYIDESHTFSETGERIPQTKYIGPEPWGRDFAPLMTFIGLAILYEVIFIWKRGQTPGKEKLKIRVTRVADGQLPTFTQALMRSSVIALFRLVPGAIMLVGNLVALVAGLPAPFNLRRRGLHDYVAGTMVVHYDAVAKEGPVVNRRQRAKADGGLGWWRANAVLTGRNDDPRRR